MYTCTTGISQKCKSLTLQEKLARSLWAFSNSGESQHWLDLEYSVIPAFVGLDGLGVAVNIFVFLLDPEAVDGTSVATNNRNVYQCAMHILI